MKTEELLAKIAQLEAELAPLKEQLREAYRIETEECAEKIKRVQLKKDRFTEEELVFAASTRCECGAGMAYPNSIGVQGAWYCSDILLGNALAGNEKGSKAHTSPLPFMFYSIKSETQPSANGATTRRK